MPTTSKKKKAPAKKAPKSIAKKVAKKTAASSPVTNAATAVKTAIVKTAKSASKAIANALPHTSEKPLSKAAYVRSLPASMKANDVVAKAKKDGITITAKHVYVIRSQSGVSKKAAGKKAATAPKGPKSKGTGTAHKPSGHHFGDDLKALSQIVFRIGMERTRAAISHIEGLFED